MLAGWLRRARARRAARGGARGFTLVEVMVALVIATIGLLGTLAVQLTVMNASANSSDAAVATQLASQALEVLSARIISAGPPVVDQMAPAVTNGWSTPDYVSARGQVSVTQTADCRFKRELKIVNLGFAQPYDVSVRITWNLDNGTPRIVRLDQERRKTW
ncbi:MAG TPA: prepilin-type N-terminal cleavage/methylation domain-containing protein [Polyangia bacterium]|nr:prepilin-type N-terminal cleavage/methylation domain-containing protein [Polyangia bacterium]